MSDASTHARRPYVPSAHESKIVSWMLSHGHPGYDREIVLLTDQFNEIVAEAGPGGNHCENTQAQLDKIDQEIKETCWAAVDRYDDWRTDALP
jgi:hypothetical protein